MNFANRFFGFGKQEQKKNASVKYLSAFEADRMLQRTNELADIANKTTDRDTFYNSVNEIKSILIELSKYEGKLPFIGSPSADLRNLERIEQKQIELLEKRIAESQKENEKIFLTSETKNLAYSEPTIFNLKEDTRIEENILLEEEKNNIIMEKGEEKENTFEEKTAYKGNKIIAIDGLDELFVEVGRFIIEKDKASIGVIQRAFRIGFNRSARIMDQLEEAGVVGEEEGTKPRKILMSADMFEQYTEECIEYQSKQKEEASEQEEVEELPSVDIGWLLKDKLNIDVDYSNDGNTLKSLKNIIIPSETNEKQIDIINMLLKFNSDETMKLILIDDSIINYNIYNEVPQLLIPVVTDTNKIDGVIHWCCAEMQGRINKFVDSRAKNIDSFNENAEGNKLSKIICIANEANEFFKNISTPLERLFMNSNMVGIYFILFSRFSLKSLSLGIIGELLEVSTADKLKILLSQTESARKGQRIVRNFDEMDGNQFERFCSGILRKNGFENVEVTQGSGDHGIDILAEKDDITYAIQCKCYSSDVGNAAVQQAHTGKSIYKKDIAVVLTNRYFTAQAKEEAAALGVKLWDRDKLNEMIGRND